MNPNTQNKKSFFVTAIICIVLVAAYLVYDHYRGVGIPVVTSTTSTSTITTTSTDQTSSNGIVTFKIPSDFGLALNKTQVLVKAYIPPCGDIFDYCLYYNSSTYQGTNLESAGIRIQKRVDLTTQYSCLNTDPEGYTNVKSVISSSTQYVISKFPVGDAGAGHYASGDLYRLSYNGTCHEFETRLGLSQYANYPEGSIREFDKDDQKLINAKLMDILDDIRLPGGEKVMFSAVK